MVCVIGCLCITMLNFTVVTVCNSVCHDIPKVVKRHWNIVTILNTTCIQLLHKYLLKCSSDNYYKSNIKVNTPQTPTNNSDCILSNYVDILLLTK